MNEEIVNCFNIVIEVVKGVALYVMPIAAFIVSLIALKRSNDTMKVQVQLSEVEEKLKEYELALKKRELEKIQAEENKEKKANIEARVIKISKGSYRLKVWNSGNETAYNVEVCAGGKAGLGKSWSGRNIYRHPDVGDGWIRDDRSPAEKKDILQNCDYKFLSRISVCKTCNGAWCR